MNTSVYKTLLCGCLALISGSAAYCQETNDIPTVEQVKAGEWKYLGEGLYFCDLVGENFSFAIYSYTESSMESTTQAYRVPVYESEEYPGWYRFAPFAGELFNGAYQNIDGLKKAYYISSEDPIYVNATDPDKVYYARSEGSYHVRYVHNGVQKADVDVVGPCVIESIVPENGLTGSSWSKYHSYGTLKENVISFPEVQTMNFCKLGGITFYNANTSESKTLMPTFATQIQFSAKNYGTENSINANRRGMERLELPVNIESGVSAVGAEADRKPYYMNLNGIRIPEPARGISLRINPDGTVSKIVR